MNTKKKRKNELANMRQLAASEGPNLTKESISDFQFY